MQNSKTVYEVREVDMQTHEKLSPRAEQYIERLNIPVEGSDGITFFTCSGLVIAEGYERVVIGDRGPYIEFSDRQIVKGNIQVPDDQLWRLEPWRDKIYYHEYRSKCPSNVKLYYQVRKVAYTDYREGLWYVSPFDLSSEQFEVLIRSGRQDQRSLF